MQNTIGLKDFRENLGRYEKLIRSGQSFVVVKRAKPIFTIGPIEHHGWETLVDFTKFKKQGIPIDDLIKRLKRSA